MVQLLKRIRSKKGQQVVPTPHPFRQQSSYQPTLPRKFAPKQHMLYILNPAFTPLALKRSCAKNTIADILSCAKIGIIPPAGIVFCYLKSCHFYFTEIETFIDTWTSDLPKQRIRTMISRRFSTLSISSRRVSKFLTLQSYSASQVNTLSIPSRSRRSRKRRSNQLALKHTTISLKAYYWQDLRKLSQALIRERPYDS